MTSVYAGRGQSVGGALGLPFLQPSKAGKAISKSGASSPARLRQRQLPSAIRGRWIIAQYAVAIRCETQAGSGVRAHLAGSFEEGSEETTHLERATMGRNLPEKQGWRGGARKGLGQWAIPILSPPLRTGEPLGMCALPRTHVGQSLDALGPVLDLVNEPLSLNLNSLACKINA